MSSPDWPSPELQSRERQLPLPRVEDLPVAEQGYDRDAVREAFDAFYRHAAQLDATLRTLETVEVFQRTASELRAELRTVRAAGWTVGGYQQSYGARGAVREWSLPPAFPRVAAEALFLIVIGVIVGIAGWSRIAIVLVMALALAIVWLVEWVASRERAIPQTEAPPAAPRLDEAAEAPAELAAGEAAGWTAFSEQEEGPEAMTMLGAEPARADSEAEPEPEVHEESAPEEVAQPIAEAVPAAVVEPEAPEEDTAAPLAEPDAVEAIADELEQQPSTDAAAGGVEVAEPHAEAEPAAEPVRQRFRLWRRGETPAGPESEQEPVAQAVDPWEREPELPVVAPEPEPQPSEPAPELEHVAAEPEPEPEPETEPEEEDDDLPVETLADQAAAALSRSRDRRRAPRRARRR